VLEEEATEDAQMQAAIQPLDESYMTTPFFVLAQKRGVWLVILLAAAFLTAWVMRGYEDLQRSYIWMAAFIPLVLASGGNAGSQSATLIIREMATTEMTGRDKYFIIIRELKMALTLGGGLMALSFAVAVCMVAVPEAIVVALTVFMMVVFGTTAGVILPLIFKRLGMDPALMSNPLIAALVDVLGVIIYFSTALALLGPVAKVLE
jgi:magnesium transporter